MSAGPTSPPTNLPATKISKAVITAPSSLRSAEVTKPPILSSLRERLTKTRTQFNPIDAGIIRRGFAEGGIAPAKNVNSTWLFL